MYSLETDPAVEELLGGAAPREAAAPPRRELACEGAAGAGLLAFVAIMAAVLPGRPAHLLVMAALVVAYAAAACVQFDVGAGYATPTQLLLVPILFAAPPALVPLLVAAGLVLRRVPGVVAGRIHPQRLIFALPDAWHTVGPALVLGLAGNPAARLGDWPLYVAAFGAQVAFDVATGTLRERLILNVAPALQIRLMALVAAIDACLAPVGLLAALAMRADRWAMVLVLPPALLLVLFARERDERIRQALELSRAYRGTALLMGDVLEADDPYTGGEHSQGVVALAIAVGDQLGLGARERRDLEFGALLHDIGKLRVPNEILNKPGALTDAEWEIMRRHPVEGQAMLERVGGTLGEVGRIVRAHHEHLDGRGYPDGLRGAQIPLAARIIAVCDAYSAMTTTRSYRRGRSPGEAMVELRRCAGTQFDPAVVEALLAVLGGADGLAGVQLVDLDGPGRRGPDAHRAEDALVDV
jgi:HD-GYP domain-containing protein (c-di-GMP phosphodiesterase class II)